MCHAALICHATASPKRSIRVFGSVDGQSQTIQAIQVRAYRGGISKIACSIALCLCSLSVKRFGVDVLIPFMNRVREKTD
jgi:hypothetical protein